MLQTRTQTHTQRHKHRQKDRQTDNSIKYVTKVWVTNILNLKFRQTCCTQNAPLGGGLHFVVGRGWTERHAF